MTVVDYSKRVTTRINRINLVRLGHISDWFDLAHGLRHPNWTLRTRAYSCTGRIAGAINVLPLVRSPAGSGYTPNLLERADKSTNEDSFRS
ncbi:protein of unknown function (plasmid) [Cupriavidus taiwanensis]|uniref:Uncharacterized protein n=1 Tax=Cupriavidus taiwanensis TaxID=164546 RepID=A0A375IVP7_9BURK|nr:protein of unknown function [Cupriavidus taiwanensis]